MNWESLLVGALIATTGWFANQIMVLITRKSDQDHELKVLSREQRHEQAGRMHADRLAAFASLLLAIDEHVRSTNDARNATTVARDADGFSGAKAATRLAAEAGVRVRAAVQRAELVASDDLRPVLREYNKLVDAVIRILGTPLPKLEAANDEWVSLILEQLKTLSDMTEAELSLRDAMSREVQGLPLVR